MAKKVKKFAGGGVYGPPASAAGPREYSSGTASPYSLGSMSPYYSIGNAGGASGFSVRPTIMSGLPGFKLRGKFAKGGSVSKRADGCAQRGKTKGKMV